jgi:transcriptional regulator with XRE-family HTH domain
MKAGELLALCRELKGLTIRDVERATGISNAFVSQVETGKANLGFENAIKLCDFYGISLDRLADTIRKQTP